MEFFAPKYQAHFRENVQFRKEILYYEEQEKILVIYKKV